MAEEILINVTPREVRIALVENSVLQEIHIERKQQLGIIGNIYKGKVNRLLPGIQAAFVEIGLERAAFLHAKDIVDESAQVDIRELLHPGQEILVQVYKDPLGSKGARLTTQFSIPGRYLVLTPNTQHISVSQKITDEVERERLTALITETDKGGFIFRTAAMGVSQAAIDTEKAVLQTLWKEITEKAKSIKAGEIVFTEIPMVLRMVRDLNISAVEKIRIDDFAVTEEMRDFALRFIPELANRIEHYADPRPIFDMHGIEEELHKALQRKVNLKSGGHLIIDQTEAMTTIDVNTGSYLGKSNSEETIYKTNIEAIDVIARQVRLRNLGGIIIIDFIDMSDAANKTHLLELLSQALAKDSARTEISELSSLGLVQMTRKRTRESLEHTLCITCPLCHRRGSLKSLETMCYDILRHLKLTAYHFPHWTGYTIVAASHVIDYLLSTEISLLQEIEKTLNKPIAWRANAAFGQEQYEILPMTERSDAS